MLKHLNAIEQLKFSKKKFAGIYLILEGNCELENPNGFNNYFATSGDIIGETLMFEAQGLNQFGRLRCNSDLVKCLHIKREDFLKIPSTDQDIMR